MESVFQLPTSVRYTNPVHADDRTGPWASVAEACAQVQREVRVPGLWVIIQADDQPAVKYWWPGPGLEDADLVPFQAAEAWQPLTPDELPPEHAAAAGLSQRETILYLFQHLGQQGPGSVFDGGYAWLTEDEQIIITEDAEA